MGTATAVEPEPPAAGVEEERAEGEPGQESTVERPGATEPWLVLALIVVLAGISAVAYYLGFVRPYLLQDYYLKPLLDLAKISGYTASSAISWAFTWIVLFACYWLAFRLFPLSTDFTRTFRRIALALICGWAAIFCISLVFMYPVGAADIFDHIFRGRMVSVYGLNPFTAVPTQIPSDPFYAFNAWKGEPSHYGPLWEVLAAGTSLLGGDSLWNNLIFFKVMVLVFHGINVALVYFILRDFKPEWALRGTLFYAWNPLLVFEIAGNGHHESVVATFMLLAIYLFVRARRLGVFPAIMAGVLTKFIPLLMVLPAAAALWRDRLRTPRNPQSAIRNPQSNRQVFAGIAIGGGIALLMAVAFYAPFWVGTRSIGALYMSALFTASIGKVVLDWLVVDVGMSSSVAEAIVRNGALAIVALTVIGLSVWIFLKRNAETPEERHTLVRRTLVAFFEVMFVYLAFATLWFQPWYLVWLIALAAPLASMTHAKRTLLFCIGGVANYFVWDFVWLWDRSSFRDNQIMSALAVYTLPLLYTLYVWLQAVASRQSPVVSDGAQRLPATDYQLHTTGD